MPRTTKATLENLLGTFERLTGHNREDGTMALDYYGPGGGYRVVIIDPATGGQSTSAFGAARRPAGQMADVLRFAIDALSYATRER